MSCWKLEWENFLHQKAERARCGNLESRRFNFPLGWVVLLNGANHPLYVLFILVPHHTSLHWVIFLLLVSSLTWKICDASLDKKKAPSPISWDAGTAEKCQVLLIHTATDASAHLHGIWGIRSKGTQLRQSSMVTHLADWPFLAARGFYALREHGNYR
jgi:hypothetical protein